MVIASKRFSERSEGRLSVKESVCFPAFDFSLPSRLTMLPSALNFAIPPCLAEWRMARDLLVRFGLGEEAQPEPYELSPAGEAAGCHCAGPGRKSSILLADEPTASLDARPEEASVNFLRSQVDDDGRTVVVVTHDPRWQEFAIAQSTYAMAK